LLSAAVRIQPQSEFRSATLGFAQIPNSIVENQALLTPAELALVLIVCRRGENTVSDEHWESWTGKDARMKNHAIRGLRDKGLRQVGRGKRARFLFDRNTWNSWVRSRPRRERATTMGRSKSVTPKSGQMIHPECRERGCQKLCEPQSTVIEITQAPASQNWKPVSDSDFSSPPNPPPKQPPKPSEQQANTFTQLMGIFISLGVELSKLDIARCEKFWASLTQLERTTALSYALARQTSEWIDRASRFIPRPWNYLAEKHWERNALPGTTRHKSASESEKRTKRVADLMNSELFKR
jgi:hypothetical protein